MMRDPHDDCLDGNLVHEQGLDGGLMIRDSHDEGLDGG